jgi:hypothetical protein
MLSFKYRNEIFNYVISKCVEVKFASTYIEKKKKESLRNRDVHGAAAVATAAAPLPRWRWRCGSGRFFKKSSRYGAAAADFLKIHRGSGAAAADFFPKTLKKCMNLIEFQC